jgi:hypothetical protein
MNLIIISCSLPILGEGEFGQRSIVDHAVEYLECARQHPRLFRTPKVMSIFLYHNPKQNTLGIETCNAVMLLKMSVLWYMMLCH